MINDYARNTLGGSTPVHLASTTVLTKENTSRSVFFSLSNPMEPLTNVSYMCDTTMCAYGHHIYSKLAAADSPLMLCLEFSSLSQVHMGWHRLLLMD